MKSEGWLFCCLLMLMVVPVHAQPPAGPHVDPKAPCFRWPALDFDGDGVFDRIDHCNDTPRGCVVDAYGCSIDGDGDGVCDGMDRCANTPAGQPVDEHGCPAERRAAQEPPASPPPTKPASESERQLVESGRIRLENVYFETNSAQLLPESEAALREAGEALEKFPGLRIDVEGHTDTRGPKGYNKRLSQERAASVRSWLIEHSGLRPENLRAKGYGEERPDTRERNDEELLRNRRVVLRVMNPEALPRGVKLERHD